MTTLDLVRTHVETLADGGAEAAEQLAALAGDAAEMTAAGLADIATPVVEVFEGDSRSRTKPILVILLVALLVGTGVWFIRRRQTAPPPEVNAA